MSTCEVASVPFSISTPSVLKINQETVNRVEELTERSAHMRTIYAP